VESGQFDTINVRTSDNVTLGYSIAGLGSRLVAQILDNLLAVPLTLIAILLYGGVANVFVTSTEGAGFAAAGAGFFAAFVYFGYFLVAEAVTGGKTPGKGAMGLRVIRLDGSAADFGALAVRNVIRIVDVAVVLIGIVVMFFQPQTRRLGDLGAGTIVVRDRAMVTLAAAVASRAADEWRITSASNVRLRRAPATDASVAAELPLGASLFVLQRTHAADLWYQVKTDDGSSGWVLGRLTALLDPERRGRTIEAIALDRLPNLRLDPDKPKPEIRGIMMRVPKHVYVRFDADGAKGSKPS